MLARKSSKTYLDFGTIFGVMGLTQGYHQAPLAFAARIFTAFIAFCGIYQFTRLPFGPKRAPSYFQETRINSVGALDFTDIDPTAMAFIEAIVAATLSQWAEFDREFLNFPF